MKNTLLLLLCILIITSCKKDGASSQNELDEEEIVLLISLDGFRHDYFDFAETPNFDKLIAEGVKADALIPIFPTRTFPNHYTQVTGLYPENHGIISNTMYDPIFDETFFIGTGSQPVTEGKWYEGEPIWATAKKNGLKSATYFWIGSEAEIAGHRPDYFKTYNGSVAHSERVDEVLNWLKMEAEMRPRFISLYFSLIDSRGHSSGPSPTALKSSIESIDETIGILIQGIEAQGKENQVNVIIVSDHGMAQLSRDRMIFLDDYISLEDVEVVNWTPNLDLIPVDGKLETVYQALKEVHPQLTVYKKEDLPESLHYKNHRRVTPITGWAENGWSISTHDVFERSPNSYQGGAHGYHPDNQDMHGIFIATGPSFKSGFTDRSFSNIHLYEMMCKILNIPSAQNDGNLNTVEQFLK